MSAQDVALIRGLYESFAAGDVPGVIGRMSQSIIWNEAENFPYADGNPYLGPDAVVAGVFARCISEWDGFACVPEQLLDAGKTVVAVGRYLGRCKATGRSMRAQFAHLWTIENGKAVRFQQYADTLQVARVRGEH
jgi:uncharacterized protein